MDEKLKELQSETSNFENMIKEFQTATLSEIERERYEKELKNTANNLQGHLIGLSESTDAKTIAEVDRAESLLRTYTDTLSLQSSIGSKSNEKINTNTEAATLSKSSEIQPYSTEAQPTQLSTDGEKKGFLGSTLDWMGEQWNALKDKEKWKTETGANLLRAGGALVTGYAIYKGIKGLWRKIRGKNKDKKEEKNTESKEEKKTSGGFWEKPLGKTIKGVGIAAGISTGIYYVVHGIYTGNWHVRDMFDRERGKKLGFEDALSYAEGAVGNQDTSLCHGMNLKYHENTSEIEAYGQRIEIDKNARKIKGLDVSFKKYEHMISTAIVIAYLKKNYSGKCVSNSPFNLTGSWRGNVNVKTTDGKEVALDGSGIGGKIVGIGSGAVAGVVSGIFSKSLTVGAAVGTAGMVAGGVIGNEIDHDNIMHQLMPELDDEYGKKSLSKYLNEMNCREATKQTPDDITESPIKPEVLECLKDIQNSEGMNGDRKLDAIQDPNNPTRYTIKAYDREFYAEVLGTGKDKKIRIMGLSEGNPPIHTSKNDTEVVNAFFNLQLPLKEGVYLSSLMGYTLSKFSYKGNKMPYFRYGDRIGFKNGLAKQGLYFNDKGMDTYLLTKDSFKKRMPKLFENKNIFIDFLNKGIVGSNENSIRRDPETVNK